MRRSVGALGVLLCACSSSSSSGSGVVAFGVQDCRGQLVEVARLVKTSPLINSIGISNNLSIDGDSLFVAYEGADKTSGLPTAGGIVAVALSGGAPRVVAAPDAAQTFWTTGAFWAAAGQVYLQDGRVLTSVPQNPSTTGTLPPRPASEPLKSAYAHDADFAYAATTTATLTIDNQPGLVVEKTPLAGGAPVVLTAETAGLVELGGMADTGDTLLLQVESGKSGVWHGRDPAAR